MTAFKTTLHQAKLPVIRFHDLRHTAAPLLLAEGVHPKVVSEMLGHATITLTLDTYSHLVAVLHAQAAAAMRSRPWSSTSWSPHCSLARSSSSTT